MARAKRTVAQAIATLNLSLTQAQIAARLGISERTVRRYKSGETQPRSEPLTKKIRHEAQNTARQLHRKGYAPAPIPLRSFRREIQEVTPEGKKIQRLSDWTNYDVEMRTMNDMVDLIMAHMNKGFLCQIVTRLTSGPDKGRNDGTAYFECFGLNREDVMREILQALWVEFSGGDEDDEKGLPNYPLYIGFKSVFL